MPPLTDAAVADALLNAVRFVLPEVALVAAACVLFLQAAFTTSRAASIVVSAVGVAAAAAVVFVFPEPAVTGSHSLLPIDPTGCAAFVRWFALGTLAVLLLSTWADTAGIAHTPEYHACLLVVAAGTSLVGRANDLVSLFLALEMISVPTYVLLYLPVRSKAGQEAAVKYFLLSLLSSGLLLFGFSYLYGLTGSTNVAAITSTLHAAHAAEVSPLAVVGMVLAIAGVGFRVTAVPFHFYAPDVYQGGPTGVVGMLAVIPKAAGFVALGRLLGLFLPGAALPFDAGHTLIPLTLWVLAAVTMTFGNVLALLQTDVKRMLAYSGVAHGGYMLIGYVVASVAPDVPPGVTSQPGTDAVLVYLVAYALMTAGAFAVLSHLTAAGRHAATTEDLAGLGTTHPLSAGLMTVFLVSLIGLPLTAGFVGKFLLFLAAFDVPTDTALTTMPRTLAIIAAVNAAVGAVYYLRLAANMYLRTPLRPSEPASPSLPLAAAVLCGVATLVLGMYPQPLADAARAASPLAAHLAPPAK